MATSKDQEFVEVVTKYLVDNPNDVAVTRKVDEMGVLLTLKVNPSDMGTIIGRQGNTAKAFRTLLRVVGAKNNARVNLKLEEPEGREERAPRVSSRAPKGKEEKESVTNVVDDLEL
ncbi:MAG: KH domain-containing protein [Candidatus Portnoybacteria bacterium]|nr:KH domain-containing protein [Candidatus Portnoybacteria bacterium]